MTNFSAIVCLEYLMLQILSDIDGIATVTAKLLKPLNYYRSSTQTSNRATGSRCCRDSDKGILIDRYHLRRFPFPVFSILNILEIQSESIHRY